MAGGSQPTGPGHWEQQGKRRKWVADPVPQILDNLKKKRQFTTNYTSAQGVQDLANISVPVLGGGSGNSLLGGK